MNSLNQKYDHFKHQPHETTPYQLKKSEVPDHIYLDVNLFNNSMNGPTGLGLDQWIPAEVNLTRDQNIIDDPSYYNLTIARFSISSSFVPRVFQASGTTGGNTTLFVSLSYNGVYYQSPIVIPVLTNPIGQQQQIIYNIQDLLDLINTGYAAAQAAAVIGGAPTGGATGGTVNMTYDPTTKFYTMNVPSYFGTGTVGVTAGNGIGVHMSWPLYEKFQSFNIIQNSPLLYAAGFNSDVTFVREYTGYNYPYTEYLTATASGPYIQLRQDASWPSSISNINRLQITVSQIPLKQEYVSTTNAVQEAGGNSNQIFPVLTDFLIGADNDLQSQGQNFIYVPTIYRISTLEGSTPLNSFSVKIYVVSNGGVRFPLYIAPTGCMCMKLLFLKKGLTG